MAVSSTITPDSTTSTCKKTSRIVTRVLATFLSPYSGNPLFISGHAIRTALKLKVPCSFGLFTTVTSLDGHEKPLTYSEYMAIRVNNYSPPFDTRKACSGNRVPFRIAEYYPVAVTFDMAGDQSERLARAGEFHLGGRRGTDHGRCRIVDTAVIDTSDLRLPGSAGWATLVSPMDASKWPPFFKKRKVTTRKQFIVRFPQVTTREVFPEGTMFKLESWFSPAKFFMKADKAPSLGYGPAVELGFGEMYFWN